MADKDAGCGPKLVDKMLAKLRKVSAKSGRHKIIDQAGRGLLQAGQTALSIKGPFGAS